MATSVSMAPSRNLPEEIVAEILLKLPIKALLRSKAVCKPRFSLISTMKSHIRSLLPTLLTLQWKIDPNTALLIHSIDGKPDYQPDQHLNPRVRHRSQSNSPVNFQRILMHEFFYRFGVVSCCNGVICLHNYFDNSVFCLWNPLLNHYKKLPVPQKHHEPIIKSWSSPILMGFGYDSISNDYKVLRLVSKIAHGNDPVMQLYSLNADSWKEFTDPILTNWYHIPRPHLVVNGVLYFHGGACIHKHGVSFACIHKHGVSFDLHEEVFGRISFPSFATEKKSDFLDFEGSVAMVFKCSADEDELTLCTLDTVSGTWTKIFRLEADLRLSFYLGAGQFYGDLCSEAERRLCSVIYDYVKKEAYYHQVPISKDSTYKVLKYK